MVTERMRGALWLAAILALAAALRVAGALGDFWMDEIWSLSTIETADSPLDFFFEIHHDSNHILHSLFVYAVGVDAPDFLLRAPYVLCGVLSVGVAWALVAHRGRLDSVVAAFLIAVSYVPVHFSSEARGYAAMGLFTLLSLRSVQRLSGPEGRGRDYALLATWAILGTLAHLTFLYFYGALLVWSTWKLLWEREGGRSVAAGARELVRWHGVTLSFLAFLAAVHLKDLWRGGGPEPPYLRVLARTVSVTVGGPPRGAWAIAVAAAALGLLFLAAWRLRRDRLLPPVFLLGATVFAPAALLVVVRPEDIAVRFFFLCTLLLLVVLATLAADGLRAGGVPRGLTALLLVAFTVGSGWHAAGLLRHRRGESSTVFAYMADQTEGRSVRVTGDRSTRVKLHLWRYAATVGPGKEIEFFGPDERIPGDVEWMLVTGGPDVGDERPSKRGPGGAYRLAYRTRSTLFSGTSWYAYRRE